MLVNDLKYRKGRQKQEFKILSRMNERSKLKEQSNKKDEYKELCREIQLMYRQAKEHYYNKICEELEDLDKKYNPKLYARIKDL